MRERPPEASVPQPDQAGGRVAALDLGEVRTGVALSDPTRSLASPLEVVASTEIDDYLRRLVDEELVGEVVVGVPRTMSGETGFQAGRALRELDRLREAFPETRFVEWDERLTTRLASPGGDGGPGGKRRGKSTGRSEGKARVDHLAAAHMLQEYLDRRA
ncbi:Holliday junction resolvase RuvX [Rubrobacter aplysinae]|uniref:Holliday junction resolvase RuvX n=1 Tax=Rubrobacter aplysinae TaxID=909625 RepID=UPI00064C46D7|nr:Holliday junction resolvase RuvX [Rubrobacter aplysinae]